MEWTLLIEWITKLSISYLPLLPKSVGGMVVGYLAKKAWWLIMPEKCVIEGCAGKAVQAGHGLCSRCYKIAILKVTKNETTWEELASLGLCSNDNLDPFSKAYNRAKGVEKPKTANEESISSYYRHVNIPHPKSEE